MKDRELNNQMDLSDVSDKRKAIDQTLETSLLPDTRSTPDSNIVDVVEELVAKKMEEFEASVQDKFKSVTKLMEDCEKSIARSSDEYSSSDVNLEDTLEKGYNARLEAVEKKNEERYQSIEEKYKSLLTSMEERYKTTALPIEEKLKDESTFRAELEENYKSLNERFTEMSEVQQKHVGFTARLGGHVQDMAPWSTLVFNQVVTNIGNAYSTATGIFTVPMDGVYIFYAHILGSQRNLEMAVQQNGQNVMYMYSHGPANSYGGDSNMVVLSLVKGDTVKVVKHGPWGAKPFYVHAAWSTFSGYMLYPL